MNTLISKFEKIFVNGEVVYSQDSEKPYQATLKTTTCNNNDNNCNWAIKEKNHRYKITSVVSQVIGACLLVIDVAIN